MAAQPYTIVAIHRDGQRSLAHESTTARPHHETQQYGTIFLNKLKQKAAIEREVRNPYDLMYFSPRAHSSSTRSRKQNILDGLWLRIAQIEEKSGVEFLRLDFFPMLHAVGAN